MSNTGLDAMLNNVKEHFKALLENQKGIGTVRRITTSKDGDLIACYFYDDNETCVALHLRLKDGIPLVEEATWRNISGEGAGHISEFDFRKRMLICSLGESTDHNIAISRHLEGYTEKLDVFGVGLALNTATVNGEVISSWENAMRFKGYNDDRLAFDIAVNTPVDYNASTQRKVVHHDKATFKVVYDIVGAFKGISEDNFIETFKWGYSSPDTSTKLVVGSSEDSKPKKNDVINPSYYDQGIPTIDYIDQVAGVWDSKYVPSVSNIIKYISRAPLKNGLEDVRKIVWYLNHLIEQMEKDEKVKQAGEKDK
ncbi:nucleotide kinase [Brochothrix phage A9]|uniref:Gp181 n=1 Tax=Brochothrix phage A9 TaxID=857312 RepID=D9J0X9_9CAUD|nr:nucleotide kinase [Brochothrix phage A9]ADJ53216.1 gp181 [Brochothrix phage A9]